ncbi:MAG: hypothetical protein LBC18_13535 [Opitutaceae bacterium]|jgi:Zn-dependent protease|nr:hypothetical protein [Opitutaceae bacterium]
MTHSIFAFILADWWNSLPLACRIFYGIAVVAALFVTLLTVLSMTGIGDDVELDADIADSGASFFSTKPLAGFLFAFGWAGGTAISAGLGVVPATLLAIVAGLAVMAAIFWLLQLIQRLKVDGTIRKEDAVGKVVTVYVSVPPGNQGGGQVTVPFDGRTLTLGAMQTGAAPIASGAKVRILRYIDSGTVEVAPL